MPMAKYREKFNRMSHIVEVNRERLSMVNPLTWIKEEQKIDETVRKNEMAKNSLADFHHNLESCCHIYNGWH